MGTRVWLLSIPFLALVTGTVTSAQLPVRPDVRLEAAPRPAVVGQPVELRVEVTPPVKGATVYRVLVNGVAVCASPTPLCVWTPAEPGIYELSAELFQGHTRLGPAVPLQLAITVRAAPPPAAPDPPPLVLRLDADRGQAVTGVQDPPPDPEPLPLPEPTEPAWPYIVAGVVALAVMVAGLRWTPVTPVAPQAAALPMTLHARLLGPWRFVPPSTSQIALEVRYASNLRSLRFTRPSRLDGAPR